MLRLPPYHCIFNPIENIWCIAENYTKTLEVWKDALNKITPEVWKNTIRHTEQEIQRWWEREILLDQKDMSPLVINTNDSESETDSDSEYFLEWEWVWALVSEEWICI